MVAVWGGGWGWRCLRDVGLQRAGHLVAFAAFQKNTYILYSYYSTGKNINKSYLLRYHGLTV